MKAAVFLLIGVAVAVDLSPVTRVVELLKGLADTVEKDGKAEEDLYESFVCWGKSVITQKTASNAAAASRIDTLETYIADLASGRIELTDERKNLEKEIGELSSEVEEMDALRKKARSDFADAEAEMTSAITALDSAMNVLGEATKDHKEGVLLAVRSRLNNGMDALQQQQMNLKHAVTLGDRFLGKADANFLRRLLTGDVPKRASAKKLNRKATFKMSYKARSFKIQDVLKKMHSTFTANLDEATQNDANAESEYQALSKAKGEQLSTAQDALAAGAAENGASAMSKQDSQDEVDNLKGQVAADEKFIGQTEAALTKRKGEWKVRSELRSAELAAFSKAIYILHNDDARDLMKKSFSSQEGFFFLQVQQQSSNAAAGALRSAAVKTGDKRLLTLARLAASPKAKFGPIVEAIDKMIAVLRSEEESDLQINEDCEHGRMQDTHHAAEVSRDIDEMTDAMTKLQGEIVQLGKDVEQLEADKKKEEEEFVAAEALRKKENAEWTQSDSEDEEAAKTVNNAKDVLESFYKDNGLVFIQKATAPVVTAGEAPPPPPATWDGDYGGKTGESTGIIAILGMVHEDIIKDKQKAKEEEDDAQASFDAFKSASDQKIEDLTREIGNKNGIKGEKAGDVVNIEGERGNAKGDLNAVMKKMADISPNCEYFAVNYKMRVSNRAVEVDGLIQAKAILQGGKFAKAPDPNREMKPGDAFLQRRA